jgi:hypothetical protein
MPRSEPTVWTDTEVAQTRWIRDCDHCPFRSDPPGGHDELGWDYGSCGHPEMPLGPGHHLLNGKGRCPLPHYPVVIRFGWPGRRPGV